MKNGPGDGLRVRCTFMIRSRREFLNSVGLTHFRCFTARRVTTWISSLGRNRCVARAPFRYSRSRDFCRKRNPSRNSQPIAVTSSNGGAITAARYLSWEIAGADIANSRDNCVVSQASKFWKPVSRSNMLPCFCTFENETTPR